MAHLQNIGIIVTIALSLAMFTGCGESDWAILNGQESTPQESSNSPDDQSQSPDDQESGAEIPIAPERVRATGEISEDMFVPPAADGTLSGTFAELSETQTVFVNFEGGRLDSHPDCQTRYAAECSSAPLNKSYLIELLFGESAVQLPGISDDGVKSRTMDLLRAAFSPYDIAFTSTRPQTGPYTMVMVTAAASQRGSAGLAPVDCGNNNPNDIVFVLESEGRPADTMSAIIAHELGHSFGLTHVEPRADYMHWIVTAEPQSFTRARFDAAHASEATKCFDGDVQDAPAMLLQALGERGREQPEACTTVTRVAGSSRHDTAANVSQLLFPAGANAVVLVRDSDVNPDALASAPLAYSAGGPILLTSTASLPTATRAEINRLNPDVVYVIGGTAAVSADVVRTLQNDGHGVERIAGASRFETAALIGERVGASDLAIVASAEDAHLVDALAASGVAAALGAPILLTARDTLPGVTAAALRELGVQRTIVPGGTASVSNAVMAQLPNARRISGATRFETAVELAKWGRGEGVSADRAFVARGDIFIDALAAGAAGSPTLLTAPTSLPDSTAAFLRSDVQSAVVLGGTVAVARATELAICQAVE